MPELEQREFEKFFDEKIDFAQDNMSFSKKFKHGLHIKLKPQGNDKVLDQFGCCC